MSKGNTSSSMVHLSLVFHVFSCVVIMDINMSHESTLLPYFVRPETAHQPLHSGHMYDWTNQHSALRSSARKARTEDRSQEGWGQNLNPLWYLILPIFFLNILCPFVQNFDERYSRCIPENIYNKYCIWLGSLNESQMQCSKKNLPSKNHTHGPKLLPWSSAEDCWRHKLACNQLFTISGGGSCRCSLKSTKTVRKIHGQ